MKHSTLSLRINRRNFTSILLGSSGSLLLPRIAFADDKTPWVNRGDLGDALGGWEHKDDEAAEFEWWDSDYRMYEPGLDRQDQNTVLRAHFKADHIRSAEKDDHAEVTIHFDDQGAINELKTEITYGGDYEIPEFVTKPLNKITDEVAEWAIDAIIEAATVTIDGVEVISVVGSEATIPTTILGVATDEIAKFAVTKLIDGSFWAVEHAVSHMGKWLEDGGTVMFPSAVAHMIALTQKNFRPTPPGPAPATRRAKYDKNAFVKELGKLFKDGTKWESKSDSKVVEYDKDDHDFRTWKPVVTEMNNGGLLLSSKIDHEKSNHKDDHGNLLIYFNPAGTMVATLYAVAKGGSDDTWTTGLVPDFEKLKAGDIYPMGEALASSARANITDQMKSDKPSGGLALLPEVLYRNAMAFDTAVTSHS